MNTVFGQKTYRATTLDASEFMVKMPQKIDVGKKGIQTFRIHKKMGAPELRPYIFSGLQVTSSDTRSKGFNLSTRAKATECFHEGKMAILYNPKYAPDFDAVETFVDEILDEFKRSFWGDAGPPEDIIQKNVVQDNSFTDRREAVFKMKSDRNDFIVDYWNLVRDEDGEPLKFEQVKPTPQIIPEATQMLFVFRPLFVYKADEYIGVTMEIEKIFADALQIEEIPTPVSGFSLSNEEVEDIQREWSMFREDPDEPEQKKQKLNK